MNLGNRAEATLGYSTTGSLSLGAEPHAPCVRGDVTPTPVSGAHLVPTPISPSLILLLQGPQLMAVPDPDTHPSLPGPSRRGSNVSLTLDMCTPGCNEEGFGYLMSPREESAREYLLSASRVLQAEELHEKALDPFLLQAEFFVSPLEPAPLQGAARSAHVHPPSKALERGTPNSASDR